MVNQNHHHFHRALNLYLPPISMRECGSGFGGAGGSEPHNRTMTAKPQNGTAISRVWERSRVVGIRAQTFSRSDLHGRLSPSIARAVFTRFSISDVCVRVVQARALVELLVLEVQVRNMVEIKCHNCDHEWDYTGERSDGQLVTCPGCYYKTRIECGTESTAET